METNVCGPSAETWRMGASLKNIKKTGGQCRKDEIDMSDWKMSIKRKALCLFGVSLLGLTGVCFVLPCQAGTRPNVVFIMADDLGWGDPGFNNPNSKIPTPCLDAFSKEGMTFSDAHAGAAVCTPTRYGIMTGRHCWRSRLKKGVLNAYSSALIEKDRLTLARMFRDKGYATACFGKWHLGMGLPAKNPKKKLTARNIDWDGRVNPSPIHFGFDTFFGITCAHPFIIVEDDHFYGTCVRIKDSHRDNRRMKTIELDELLPEVKQRAISYIGKSKESKKPFFLYVPLTAPHTPIAPSPFFKGKSGIGAYGDFCVQVDHVVGKILEALKNNGLERNTIVIFTSDNGCSPAAGTRKMVQKGHHASGPYRGYKADIYEGGHRIPFVIRWPGRIKAGSLNSEPICLTDAMATFADLIGFSLPNNAAEDSVNIMPAFLGTPHDKPLHEAIVHQSIRGALGIRQGKWKLEMCAGSGGWSNPRPGPACKGLPEVQLYDMTTDISERKNLYKEYPDVVKRLTELLRSYKSSGRSVPKR